MKSVHEKFYGQAVREIECDGVIRHDLWAKAGALSVGDREAAKAIYIDLLARQFAKGANRAEREDLKQTALGIAQLAGKQGKVFGFRALCWGIWAALVFATCMFGQHWVGNLYDYSMGKHGALVVRGLDNKTREDLKLIDGNIVKGPTEREYTQAAIAHTWPDSRQYLPHDFPQIALDSAGMDFDSLRLKYDMLSAVRLNGGNIKAIALLHQLAPKRDRDYILAIKMCPLWWLLLATIFCGALVLATWFALRTHRRGRFEAPLWMQI